MVAKSPLLLALFSALPLNTAVARILWTCCDLLSAYLLRRIWKARSRRSGSRGTAVVGAYVTLLCSRVSGLKAVFFVGIY